MNTGMRPSFLEKFHTFIIFMDHYFAVSWQSRSLLTFYKDNEFQYILGSILHIILNVLNNNYVQK